MALNRQVLNGLSNTTAFQSVSSVGQRTTYSDTTDPKVKYEKFKNENTGAVFKKFPREVPKYKTIIVARAFPGQGQSKIGQKSIAKAGFVLPIPSETPLIDTYQVGYDDNFSLMAVLAKAAGVGENTERVGRFFGFNLNRQKSVLLEAPFLKRHEFRWKLAPKNSQESVHLDDMIRNLKMHSMPYVADNTADSILTFPDIFEIYFDPNYAFLYPLKPCVIESISVNYTGNGQTTVFYNNGAPESLQLTINFLELEFWTRQDWEKWMERNNPVNTLSENNTTQSIIDYFKRPLTQQDAEEGARIVSGTPGTYPVPSKKD